MQYETRLDNKKTRQDNANKTMQYKAIQGNMRQDKARQDKTRQDTTRQHKIT